ncbi:MAG: hypothetical protein R3F17_04650 [Planctomycetota bacterium]
MIAVQTEFFALQGLSKLVEVVQPLRCRANPALTLTGIIPCLYDSRLKLAREVLAELRRFFPGKVFKTPIRSNVKLAESPSHGLTIFEYAPESNGASDYENLATLILAQDGHEPAPSTHPGPVQKDAQALELENAAKGLREIELPADGVVEELEEEIPEPADASHEDPDSVEPDPEFSEDEDSASTADAIRRRNDGVDAELAAYELPRLARPEPTHPVVRADGVHAPMPAAKLDSGAAPAASPEPRAQATLEVETLPAEEALAPEDEPAGGFEEAVTPPEIESTVAGPELKPTEAESVGIEVEASPSAEALHAAHAPQVPQNDPHEAAQAEKAVHATRAQQASLDYAPGKAPTVGSKATVAANDSEPVGFDSEAEVAQTVSRTSDAGLDPQASPDGAPEAEWNAAEPEAPADRDGEDATSLAESAEDSDLPEVDVPRPTAQAEPDPDPETPEPARGPQVAARIAKAPEKRIPPTPIYGHSAYLGEDRWTWRPLPNR